MGVLELQKPQGTWCAHCAIGEGCRIYESKPDECSSYFCGYLTTSELDDDWKPSRSKLVLTTELGGGRLAVYVDPGYPSAWRVEPFYSRIKQWAWAAQFANRHIVVVIGRRMILVLPESEMDLGQI